MSNWKKEAEITNIIRTMADFFGMKNETRITNYAQKLAGKDVNLIKNAVDRAIEQLHHFPSLAALNELIRPMEKNNDTKYQDFEYQLEAESIKLNKIIDTFNKQFGKEHLERYVKSWYINVYHQSQEELKKYNLSVMLFLKPALFDLHDANFNPKLAIKIGQKKLEQL